MWGEAIAGEFISLVLENAVSQVQRSFGVKEKREKLAELLMEYQTRAGFIGSGVDLTSKMNNAHLVAELLARCATGEEKRKAVSSFLGDGADQNASAFVGELYEECYRILTDTHSDRVSPLQTGVNRSVSTAEAVYDVVMAGNGSLLTVQAFIDAENRREYTTPHTIPLRGRRDDVHALVRAVGECQAVLVTGASGLGKTRVALEAVRAYAEEYHCESFVIDSHSSRDISADANQFLRSGRAVVLVDDVDQLIDLRPLLQVALLNSGLKLVLTVRNYAANKVEAAMQGYMKHVTQNIAPLDKAEVTSILKEDLGITNPYYIEQIERVAKGNLRLAIMAGMQGKDHGYPAIRNAYSILALFFSSLSEHLTDDDMRILEELSLNGVTDLAPGDWAYDRIAKDVCDCQQLSSSVTRLSNMSILDMMINDDGTRGVRFEQQNLRDYCVYRALMVDRVVSLEEYIRVMIGTKPDALCVSLNTLLGSFSCDETIDEAERAARSYWRSLPKSDVAARQVAMGLLHQLLEPYDLEYAQELIEGIADGEIVTGEEYQRATTGPASLPMAIACGTKGSPHWSVGMDLLATLFKKGGDTLGSYKVAFEQLLAPDEVSIANGYEDECHLLTRMSELAQDRSSPNLAIALLRLCELYLKVEHVAIVGGDGPYSYAIKHWHLPYSDALKRLRCLAFSGLVMLCRETKLRSEAVNNLLICFPLRGLNDDIARGDIDSLSCCLREDRDLLQGEDGLLYAVQETCSALGLCYGELFGIEPNPNYVLVRSIYGSNSMDRYLDNTQTLEALDVEALNALIKYCASRQAVEQLDEYKLHYVTNRVLLYVSDHLTQQCVRGMFESLCASVAWRYLSSYTLASVIGACGYENARNVALRYELRDLVASIDGQIPETDVNERTVAVILTNQSETSTWLKVEGITRIDSIQPGFARKLWTAKEHWLLDDPSSVVRFLDSVGYNEDAQAILESMVGEDAAQLKEFFFANMNDRRFDTSGAVFAYLFTKRPEIVKELVTVASVEQGFAVRHAVERLGYLSKLPEDSFEWLGSAVDSLADSASPWLIADLLSDNNAQLQDGFMVTDFIVYYITTRWDNLERIDALMMVVEDLAIEARYDIYSRVFAQISDRRMLQFLPVYPVSFSGYGNDGFAPQYAAEIAMLKRLSSELPGGSGYVAHRVRIEEMIDALERDKKRERWGNFHGRR